MSVIEIISTALIALGALVMLVGAAGVLRLPDFYVRLHAAGKGDTLGQGLVLLGLALPVGFGLISLKLALIILFVFIFNPTATHALARAAWVTGLKPWEKSAGEPIETDEDDAEGERDHA
ncbi:MAG: monovalent cation/H(+) antiporter subunit G [Planctomycetota bacterium]|nr:monovalent cation/H(+) antiporter subunit G [Planctomycetota bacterium]